MLTPKTAADRPALRLRFGAQLVVFFLLALGVLALAWWALHGPGWSLRLPHKPDNDQLLDMVKIALSVVAGVGGVIALTVAYRKQHLGEAAEHRENTKAYTERFGACVAQLSDDKAATRLGGAYALAHLADDWQDGRQTCIDVLCAQLRMPYDPDEPNDREQHAAFLAQREVRHTIWRLIGNHLRPGATAVSWCGHDFDFTAAVIDGADLRGAHFTAGTVNFHKARFTNGTVNFHRARLTGGELDFTVADFTDGAVYFTHTQFAGGRAYFGGAHVTGGLIYFDSAQFAGCAVYFTRTQFTDGNVDLTSARFTDGEVNFFYTEFTGSTVDFRMARFAGGTVDLSKPGDYSVPPVFDEWDTPPHGLLLPPAPVGETPTGWPDANETAGH